MSASEAAEPSSLRLIGTLTVAGLASGLILVGAYVLTKPIIDANNAAALERAVLNVLPGTTTMQPLVLRDGALVLGSGGPDDKDLPTIYLGRDEGGALTGYAIPAEGNGFQDVIRLVYGYQPDRGVIIGLEVRESKETPGLGDKIMKDAAFLANFQGLTVQPAVVAKPQGTKSASNEIDCITGATISSKAVVKIVNAGNEQWLGLIPEGDPWQGAEAAPAPEPAPEPALEPAPEPAAEAAQEVTP